MIKYKYRFCLHALTILFREMNAMNIIKFQVGDTVELKKPHPCGSHAFRILRVGTQIRMLCIGCGHDMTIDRVKLEKRTKHIVHAEKHGEQPS